MFPTALAELLSPSSSLICLNRAAAAYVDGELQQLVTVVREHGHLRQWRAAAAGYSRQRARSLLVDGELQQLVTVV